MAKKANNPFARTLISNANMDPAQKFRIGRNGTGAQQR